MESEKQTRDIINAWRMLYIFMDNVKTIMDDVLDEKNGDILKQDVYDIVDYINQGISNIKKNTIEKNG